MNVQTIARYVTDRGITVRIAQAGRYKVSKDGWEHHAYRLQLVRKDEDGATVKSPTFAWSQGLGVTSSPDVKSDLVLDSLVSDATAYRNATDAADFAFEFGYEDESDAARIYRACGKIAAWLVDFLGGTEEFETVAYELERL